ncbi:MAG: hypothetical protein ACYTGL_14225 [Planctomycetota bacterium]|jgi:hypothetical protein
MKKSEKTLLIVLLASLGVFVVIPWFWSGFMAPITAQQDKLDAENRKLDKANDTVSMSMAQVRRMVDFKARSLSSNSSQGANAYQQWLTDLAEIVAEFRNPNVSTERVALSRDKAFSTVRVRIDGEGTAEQLQEFLFRFHRANVLHRIVGMHIEALDNSARPRLSLRITAEAISLAKADVKGPTLFPRTGVATVSEDRLTVRSTEGFPEEAPFEVRIGDQYLTVAETAEKAWTLELTEGTSLAASEGDIVELSPIHEDFADATLADFATFVEQNPFAKPAPYEPRLDLIGSKSFERGNTLELSAKASGFAPGDGDVAYEFASEVPEGMKLDGDKLTWTPAEDAEAGEQMIKLKASGGGLAEPFEAEFTLTLKDVNTPPTLELAVTDPLSVTIGKTASFTVTAADKETPVEELKFAVAQGAPEGVTYDEESKSFKFTPASGSQIGDIQVPVQVTDGGETPQTTTLNVAINVEDDKAQFTVFTGMVAADSDRQIWLRDQSTNEKLVLRKGDRLQYAGFDAEVLDIGRDFFTFQQKNDTLKLQLGQTLRDATVIASIDPPAAEPATTEPPAADAPSEEPDEAEASEVGRA